jgi:methylamine dehydrogenase light chain
MALDKLVEDTSRALAQKMGRRSFLARFGVLMVGSVLPLLPMQRGSAAPRATGRKDFASKAQTSDDTACDYWRYCAIDGALCSCCGGTPVSCPPGTVASPSSWVGSCRNPDNGKTYLVAYRDCCGKDSCNRCACMAAEGESPAYRPQLNSDIIWCFGAPNMTYHCSSAAIIGEVEA